MDKIEILLQLIYIAAPIIIIYVLAKGLIKYGIDYYYQKRWEENWRANEKYWQEKFNSSDSPTNQE